MFADGVFLINENINVIEGKLRALVRSIREKWIENNQV